MTAPFGNVYIFNLYVEGITAIGLNNQPVTGGTIAGPLVSTTPPYVPQQLSISRTNLNQGQLNSALFVQGMNTITVDVPGQSWTGKLNIDPVAAPALAFDMWLYVATVTQESGLLAGIMMLFDTQGHMLPQSGPGGILTLSSSGASSSDDTPPSEDKGSNPPLGGGGGGKY
jgi:hypothetical protein